MLFRKLYEKPIFILVDTLYISKQNCRIWGSENPNIVLQKLKHPLPVTVWCDLYSEGIISPFFENEDCATKITAFFLYPPIYGFDMNYVWIFWALQIQQFYIITHRCISRTKRSLVMGALASVRLYLGFLRPKYGNFLF